MWRNPIKILLAGTVLTILSGWSSVPHFRVNLTNSIPRGLYRVTNSVYQRGEFVMLCIPPEWAALAKEREWVQSGSCPGKVMRAFKQIAALPGDAVEITDSYVAVNGSLVPNTETKKVDSKGRAMPAFNRGTFTVKPGQVFLIATNAENSLDSRYMGPVPITNLISTLQSVWVEREN